MLYQIASIQLTVFLFFYVLENRYPAYNHPVPPKFGFWWLSLGLFALVWLRVLIYFWIDLPAGLLSFDLPVLAEGFLFYLVYSFGNYWFHRVKHSNKYLWHFVHRFHHSTSHMETRVAFYRHPTEVLLNTVYLVLLGKLVFGLSAEALVIALAIEGCLESFHHANIAIPKRLHRLGYLIQLPSMHLVHHEYRLHRFNYAPFLWDAVFKTARIPAHWDKRLGLSRSHDIKSVFVFK